MTSIATESSDAVAREKLIQYFNNLVGEQQTQPFSQTKLFVAGRATDQKEDFLISLCGKEALDDGESKWDERIIRGHYNVTNFSRVKNVKTVPTLENPRFVLWDYTWRAEFSFVENLLLTMQTVYVVLFDAASFVKDKQDAINYLRLFLGSKRLYGRGTPNIIVATNTKDLSEQDLAGINNDIQVSVLVDGGFSAVFNGVNCFFPVDSSKGTGIQEVKKQITSTILSCEHLKERIPKALLRTYNNLMSWSDARGYIKYYDMRKRFSYKVSKAYQVSSILKLMHIQGMLIFFAGIGDLEEYVIYRPEFLLNAIKIVLYRDGGDFSIKFDGATMGGKFMKFNVQKVLEKDFLYHVWNEMGFKSENLKSYLTGVMVYTKMIANYEFDTVESFLVPTFYKSNKVSEINDEQFNGARFVIDFSCQQNQKFQGDGFVRYMPSGFFEKIIVACLELSASFKNRIKPTLEYQKAQISFGGVKVFMLKLIKDGTGANNWIECKVISAAKMPDVVQILRRVYLIVNGIKQDFYDGDSYKLAISPLLQASEEGNKLLADFYTIKENKTTGSDFHSIGDGFNFVNYNHFKQWFSEAEGQDFTPFDPSESLDYNPPQQPAVALPDKLTYHCFLSYKATTASPVVKKQFDLLSKFGFTCWLDTECGGAGQAKEIYLEGVKNCACFILVLSKDVFTAPLILEEMRIAQQMGKKIIFLQHPNTGKVGQEVLESYYEEAPEDLKPLIKSCESYRLEKRFYMQEKITNNLARSIQSALEN